MLRSQGQSAEESSRNRNEATEPKRETLSKRVKARSHTNSRVMLSSSSVRLKFRRSSLVSDDGEKRIS